MAAERLKWLIQAEAGALSHSVRAMVTLYGVAGLMGALALTFAIGAGYLAVAERVGPIMAALYFAGGTAVIGALFLIIARFVLWSRVRRRSARIGAIAPYAATRDMIDAVPAGLIRRHPLAASLLPAAVAGYVYGRKNTD